MATLTTKIAHIVSGDIVSKGFGFLITIYLTRVLGTEGFGMVTVAMAYLGYAVFFADFGLFTIGSREVAKPEAKRDFSTLQILNARIAMSFLIFIASWFLLPFLIEDQILLSLTRGYIFVLLVHAFLIEWYFNGTQRYQINAISKTVHTGIYTLGAFVFVKSTSDLSTLPIVYVFGFIISTIILYQVARKDHPFKKNNSNNFSVYRKLIKSTSSVGSGLLFAQVIQLLPPIVIGIFLSTSDAGLYGAAYRLIIIGMLIDRLFVQLLIPNLAKQWAENKDRATQNMEHTSRIMLFVGALLSIFIAIGAHDFSSFLFGNDFLESGSIVVALSLFLFFTFQNSMFSHGLVAIGKDIQFFKATSYGGFLAVLFIVVTAIYFDSVIVGLAVAISEFCIASLCFFWFSKSLPFKYIRPFFSTLTVALLVFYSFTFIELIPTVKAITSSLFLGTLLLVFKILRITDIRWLISILKK